jgi:hypothetical protein
MTMNKLIAAFLLLAFCGCRSEKEYSPEQFANGSIKLTVVSTKIVPKYIDGVSFSVLAKVVVENRRDRVIFVYPRYQEAWFPACRYPLAVFPLVNSALPVKRTSDAVRLQPGEKRSYDVGLSGLYIKSHLETNKVYFDLIYGYGGIRSQAAPCQLDLK